MKKSISRTLHRLFSSYSPSLELLLGSWKSSVKGQGLEVEEVRPFSPGDNPLSAVWSRFAQTGTLYSKVFREEREKTVYLALDTSGSVYQGSGKRAQFGKEVALLILWAALTSRDKVGAILPRKERVQVVRPHSGMGQLELLIQEIEQKEPLPIPTSLSSFFMNEKEARGMKRSLLFYLSDFIEPAVDWKTLFSSLSMRHEVVLLRLCDQREEEELSSCVGLPCFNPEGGGEVTIVTETRYRRRKESILECQSHAEMAATALHLPLFSLDVQEDPFMQLIDVLIKRRQR